MDKFSHDLTVALMEETSFLDRARVSRCGQRRRTRSTGNLPCAPQPTEKEDSSSSPSDGRKATNIDCLEIKNVELPTMSDSDDKEIPLPCNSSLKTSLRLGTLESDSLNETFSPARFFKPSARRKRKCKRMSMECDLGIITPDRQDKTANMSNEIPVSIVGSGTLRKRVLKPDPNNRGNLFFCGKRKRSNRDRYHDYDQSKSHSTSMPRFTNMEDNRLRPRSYSSTSKPNSERLLPLNKGLLSKIEKISQSQNVCLEQKPQTMNLNIAETYIPSTISGVIQAPQQEHASLRKKRGLYRRNQLQQLQFTVDQHPMDCGSLNDFLSSSSLSSSDSDYAKTTNDTDREGDDELTDWPGNEYVSGSSDIKNDSKRKLTKKCNNIVNKSDESSFAAVIGEDDTIMLGSEDWSPNISQDNLELRHRPSEPITIVNKRLDLGRTICDDTIIPFKQIESEMSGETSNTFLSSPPAQLNTIREIRAGCRRIKEERPGFSIKTSVNERLARFLQDPRQVQIRLPDVEIYEHDSLLNLATLYSLRISLSNGCAVLNKTSNTTQSVNIDQNNLQKCLLSDFKRRCYGNKSDVLP
ncbi:PREDICTED: uncharacterized protein LOC108365914 isoform X1 [Rhagoletis zephyria]|uniref:uncharacterized protein LOC108365914 isoform X1 n=2 Tax=Rhagoletis zephyria TaxID=28612 RepID=UPI00081159E5|nr:PREDICTED: uncharacterized protein LOC108365914 isoform X1 [Rhagoletis zephyria]